MDDTFLTQITNGTIEDINISRNGTFILVSYTEGPGRREQTIRLNVTSSTAVLSADGERMPVTALRVGMTVNAAFSDMTTRSIPPQSAAYVIQVVERPREENVTVGRIVDVDRRGRSIMTVSDRDPSSAIRFNVPDDVLILNGLGRPMNFSNLVPGLRVRVRHAAFMTMSIPPQTTAFEIRVIR